jgi:hypothetical protein
LFAAGFEDCVGHKVNSFWKKGGEAGTRPSQ